MTAQGSMVNGKGNGKGSPGGPPPIPDDVKATKLYERPKEFNSKPLNGGSSKLVNGKGIQPKRPAPKAVIVNRKPTPEKEHPVIANQKPLTNKLDTPTVPAPPAVNVMMPEPMRQPTPVATKAPSLSDFRIAESSPKKGSDAVGKGTTVIDGDMVKENVGVLYREAEISEKREERFRKRGSSAEHPIPVFSQPHRDSVVRTALMYTPLFLFLIFLGMVTYANCGAGIRSVLPKAALIIFPAEDNSALKRENIALKKRLTELESSILPVGKDGEMMESSSETPEAEKKSEP